MLSFYYYPDLSAGSFRATSLVKQIIKEIPGVEIEVITTLPNRYASFNPVALALEKQPQLKIHRVQLLKHQNGMIDQARSFVLYAKKVMSLSHKSNYDLIFATSSRLMTATLGAWLSKTKKIPLYLDIRDLFVDTLCNVLPKRKAYIARPFFTFLERWTFNQAVRINLVSQGFNPYFEATYPEKELRFFTNGIDDEFVGNNILNNSSSVGDKTIQVLYAGNIGEGQGLQHIIPPLAKFLEEKVRFKILGDGGKKNKLNLALENYGCTNVDLLSPVDRGALIQEYQEADVLFLHLNNHEAFKKVLPSKLFEYAALGKPIWAGVAGYPAQFIQQEISNAAIFKPGDYIEAANALSQLTLQTIPREKFIKKYNREQIMSDLSQDIKFLLNSKN